MRSISLFLFFTTVLCNTMAFCNTPPVANPVLALPTHPQQAIMTPSAPTLDVRSYILLDATSGKILAEKEADTQLPPASLTKLMSMYVISGALKSGMIHLDDKVKVSTKAWKTGGSRMFIKVNDDVPVKDLLQGIVVASGNDATVAMAEYVGGTEEAFATLMNTQAASLHLTHTHFLDSTGLPNPNHYSTARDLSTLAAAIVEQYPEDYKLYSEKSFTYNNIHQPNRNRLLWHYPDADGLKTGHTDEAGFCLVGSAINKEGRRLISVVMGAPSDTARTEDSVRLLTYGFRFFETRLLYASNSVVTSADTLKGVNAETPLGILHPFYITLPTGQFAHIETSIDTPHPLVAPLVKGQPYGTLNVILNKQVIASEPLVALDNNPHGGFLHNMIESARYHYHTWFSPQHEKANNG